MPARTERLFLGWDRPFLDLAAPRWIELVRERELDPARCVVVLPGRRAARRFEERLSELAPPEWAPPRVVSEGELAGVLRRERRRSASEWQRALGWREALLGADARALAALWAGGRDVGLGGLARTCARAFGELATEGLDAATVAEQARTRDAFGSPQRWEALAGVERAYVEALARRGRIDPSAAAREAARDELDDTLHVQLLAVVDPPRALRELLSRLSVDAFVFAPEALAERFDEFGALLPDEWAEADLALRTERWRVVDGPDDQAREALAEFARLESPPAPEDVAIGVPDEDVLPFLERRLIEAGCEPRWAGGRALAGRPEARLLLSATAWLARPSVDEFAELARHPDFEALCGLGGGELSAALDRYVAEHAPASIDEQWAAATHTSTLRAVETLRGAVARAKELFGEVAREPRSSRDWADALARWLTVAYPDVDLATQEPRTWRRARTLEALASICAELRDADEGVEPLALAAPEFRELFEARVAAAEVPPPPPAGDRPVVELFGWLELVLDDARHLVVTGVQEGSLPTASNSAGLLGEPARRALGLGHEQRRVARDAWTMAAILASRPEALFITGRRSASRDPLRPSRFVFRCAPERALQRVRAAWPDHEAEPPRAEGVPPPYSPPRGALRIPDEMRVTDFKSYLTSPYGFYVERVLRAQSVAERVLELDPRGFGNLAHDVLEALGRDELRSCVDEPRLRQALEARLDELAAARFGAHPRPALWLQIEKLRARLRTFAAWQARTAREGWRIERVEWSAPPFELDGMRISGRIDRIDRHATSGAWRVVDYKTGDARRTPFGAHYHKTRGWRDLQLPLYRELTRELCGDAAPTLGYLSIAKDDSAESFAPFLCSDEQHESALDAAREVIRAIRAGEFWEVGGSAPSDASLAALCGFGLLADDETDEPEEGEEG